MAKNFTLSSIFCLLLLAITMATSSRILDDITPPFPFPAPVGPIPPPETTTTLPSGQIPAVPTKNVAPEIPQTEESAVAPAAADIPTTDVAPDVPPVDEPAIAPVAADIPEAPTAAATATQPITTPTAPLGGAGPDTATATQPITTPTAPLGGAGTQPITTPTAPLGGAGPSTATATQPITTPTAPLGGAGPGTFSFFMHDILGGSHPSGRAVAGIVANSDANNLPFSKPSNPIFPINGGVPLNTVNGVINNNNYPFLVGLNGAPSSTLVQSNGNNVVNAGNNNQAFVTAGQLPQGLTLNQLTFGSVTVVDNEITEGHELGSGVLGKVQGMYMTSSSDGSSHTVALTAAFHGHEHEVDDTLSFFGVHRTATPVSHIAIIGGTGKYENAKGFAAIEALPHVDQHTTDGIETITHFTVYITP